MGTDSQNNTVHTCTTYLRTTNLGPSGGNPSIFELFPLEQNTASGKQKVVNIIIHNYTK